MTHPNTPMLPDDKTLEAMETAHFDGWMTTASAHGDKQADLMRAALSTPAFQTWLSSLLAQNDRALPELPEGWRIHMLLEPEMQSTRDPSEYDFACQIRDQHVMDASPEPVIQHTGYGPTPRQAVLNAIKKIGEG